MSPPQRAPRRRVSTLRLTALSAVVALSAALPLTAASAGSVDAPAASASGAESADGRPGGGLLTGPFTPLTSHVPDEGGASDEPARDGREEPAGGARVTHPPRESDDAAEPDGTGGAGRSRAVDAGPREYARGGPRSVCGPQVSGGERVTAQTCVLEEEGHTWGRTYYRNDSGGRLLAVLTLLRPDGRTLQVHCELPASGNPGTCETPRERTVHPLEGEQPYRGVAEIASADGEHKLLRSGSNSPESMES